MIIMAIVDISKYVPFKLEFDSKSGQIIKAEGIEISFSTRKLSAMKDVIYDVDWLNDIRGDFDLI